MATITKSAMKWVLNYAGTSPDTIVLDEGASVTAVKGELGFYSAGYAVEISSDTPSTIYGMFAEPAHNGTAGANKVAMYRIHENLLFEGNVLTTGLADYVLTQADLGQSMAIQRDTTNSMTFLNAATQAGGNCRVFVHEVATGSAVGDTNARVKFSFIPKYIQGVTSS